MFIFVLHYPQSYLLLPKSHFISNCPHLDLFLVELTCFLLSVMVLLPRLADYIILPDLTVCTGNIRAIFMFSLQLYCGCALNLQLWYASLAVAEFHRVDHCHCFVLNYEQYKSKKMWKCLF